MKDDLAPFLMEDPQAGRRQRRAHARPMTIGRSVYEWVALALLLCSPIIGMVIFGAVRMWSAGPLMAAALMAAALVWLKPLWFHDAETWRPPVAVYWALPFVGFALLQLFLVPAFKPAWQEWLMMLTYLMAYMAWTDLLYHFKRWKWVMGFIIFASMLVTMYALIQQARGSNIVLFVPSPYGMRASGTYVCPNHFAAMIEVMATVCVVMLIMPSSGVFLKLLSGYSLLLYLPAMLLSQSRSGWLGITAGFCTVALLTAWRKSRRYFAATMLVLPLILALVGGTLWQVSPIVRARVLKAIRYDHRPMMWAGTLDMIQDAPVIGHGGGSFRWVYTRYAKRALPSFIRYAHNEYLHLTSEYGLLGLLLMGSFLTLLIIFMLRMVRGARHNKDAHFAIMGLGVLAATAVHAVFDYQLHIYSVVSIIIPILAAASAQWHTTEHVKPIRLAVKWRTAVAAGLTVVCLLGATASLHAAYSFWLQTRADAQLAHLEFDRAEELYKQLIALDPAAWRGYFGLGEVQRNRAFWDRDAEMRKQFAAEALTWYERARKTNPHDLASHYGPVELLKMQHDYDAAIERLDKIIAAAPGYSFYRIRKGLMLREAGRYEEALEAFQGVLKIPELPDSLETDRETALLNIQSLKKIIRRQEKTSRP